MSIDIEPPLPPKSLSRNLEINKKSKPGFFSFFKKKSPDVGDEDFIPDIPVDSNVVELRKKLGLDGSSPISVDSLHQQLQQDADNFADTLSKQYDEEQANPAPSIPKFNSQSMVPDSLISSEPRQKNPTPKPSISSSPSKVEVTESDSIHEDDSKINSSLDSPTFDESSSESLDLPKHTTKSLVPDFLTKIDPSNSNVAPVSDSNSSNISWSDENLDADIPLASNTSSFSDDVPLDSSHNDSSNSDFAKEVVDTSMDSSNSSEFNTDLDYEQNIPDLNPDTSMDDVSVDSPSAVEVNESDPVHEEEHLELDSSMDDIPNSLADDTFVSNEKPSDDSSTIQEIPFTPKEEVSNDFSSDSNLIPDIPSDFDSSNLNESYNSPSLFSDSSSTSDNVGSQFSDDVSKADFDFAKEVIDSPLNSDDISMSDYSNEYIDSSSQNIIPSIDSSISDESNNSFISNSDDAPLDYSPATKSSLPDVLLTEINSSQKLISNRHSSLISYVPSSSSSDSLLDTINSSSNANSLDDSDSLVEENSNDVSLASKNLVPDFLLDSSLEKSLSTDDLSKLTDSSLVDDFNTDSNNNQNLFSPSSVPVLTTFEEDKSRKPTFLQKLFGRKYVVPTKVEHANPGFDSSQLFGDIPSSFDLAVEEKERSMSVEAKDPFVESFDVSSNRASTLHSLIDSGKLDVSVIDKLNDLSKDAVVSSSDSVIVESDSNFKTIKIPDSLDSKFEISNIPIEAEDPFVESFDVSSNRASTLHSLIDSGKLDFLIVDVPSSHSSIDEKPEPVKSPMPNYISTFAHDIDLLIDSAKNHLQSHDLNNAKKKYNEAKQLYSASELDDDTRGLVYDSLRALYDSIHLRLLEIEAKAHLGQ